jgi:hypothetical protein
MGGVAPRDPADEAMVARAHERFAADRRRARGRRRADAALPNLVVIGGLKCGTTSLHHYLSLHPEIGMSRPKELNFFVEELNWKLGADWYANHFSARSPIRGESSPHYTNLPRFAGVAERMRHLLGADTRLIYMVRDPIERLLSHYVHNVGGGYDDRPLEGAVADPRSPYVQRGLYAMQLEPYFERFQRSRILVTTQDELDTATETTMRRVFEFVDVDATFSSPHFSRRWETGTAKSGGRFRLLDRAVRLPGLRALDRRFDRLPESLRWLVERIVHDPGAGEGPKPPLPDSLRERLVGVFQPDLERLESLTGRRFGWLR